ncbi:Hypothetical protein SMAX5B_005251 [Scophthalmus maximus]|uniref:Uncharacterized protein n=1 Tax=Scophthalmus maximus TaxID=52904 RepID=A0A2U9CGY5_SCOMX|nr:Hypothetical protein SMAX5B_005251 [Scophthalmus maximus]
MLHSHILVVQPRRILLVVRSPDLSPVQNWNKDLVTQSELDLTDGLSLQFFNFCLKPQEWRL